MMIWLTERVYSVFFPSDFIGQDTPSTHPERPHGTVRRLACTWAPTSPIRGHAPPEILALIVARDAIRKQHSAHAQSWCNVRYFMWSAGGLWAHENSTLGLYATILSGDDEWVVQIGPGGNDSRAPLERHLMLLAFCKRENKHPSAHSFLSIAN